MVEIASLGVEGYLNAVAWNIDGSRLAALSGFGNQITVWDVKSWREIASFSRYGGAYSGNSLAYLADGTLLLPAPIGRSPDPPYRELYLTSFEQIDPSSGKRVRYVEDKFFDRGRRRIMETFAVARGLQVAGIPTGNPALISLFQAAPWALKANFDVTEGDPRYGFARALALSHDGGRLAVGTANGRVKTFDTTTGEPVLDRDFGSPSVAISAVALSRDGRYLALGRSRGYAASAERVTMLRILSADTLEDVGPGAAVPFENVFSIAWGAGHEIAVASSDRMEVARVEPDGTFVSRAAQPARDFYSVAYSPAGQLAAAKGSSVSIYQV